MAARAHGFSFIEVLLALVLLAVCLVPAMNAVRDAVATPKISLQGAQAVACLTARMASLAAEPYQSLLNAAGPINSPSGYSLASSQSCPARDVMIASYDPDNFPYFMAGDTGLLYLVVSTRPSPGASPMSLTTMVAR